MKVRIALALALSLVGASTAMASTITYATQAGITYSTSGFTDFSVTSSQMNGMQITAYWTVNGVAQGPQTAAWNSGVSFTGADFDLIVAGDTFNNNAWDLDFIVSGNGLLQTLIFNGVPGNTVFDRTNPSTGTPGSDQGKDLAGFGDYDGNILATYFNQVIVGANPFVGDTYAGLRIDFQTGGGLGESTSFGCGFLGLSQCPHSFSLDTDIATAASGPTLQAVPDGGATVGLLGVALLGLGILRRKFSA